MRKRLEAAFDTMTMPDSCAQRIEQQLTARLKARQGGKYVQTLAPKPKKTLWPVLATAACAAFIMTEAFLQRDRADLDILNMELTGPEQVVNVQQTEPEDTLSVATPEDHYQLATDLSVQEVEAFAQEIRETILSHNWYGLATRLHYPIILQETEIESGKAFTDLVAAHKINPEFVAGIQREDCREMFCNWQGISMGDYGQVWFAHITEEDGWTGLKITGLNGLLLPEYNFDYEVLEDGSVAMTRYTGSDVIFSVPSSVGGRNITVIGGSDTDHRGFADCDHLKEVYTYSNLVTIGDDAFAACGSLEKVILSYSVEKIGSGAFRNCPNLKTVYFQGDAPDTGSDIFASSPNVTVYYHAGTKGWGDTWQGRPTKAYIDYRNHEDLQLFYELFFPTAVGTIGRDLIEFQTEAQRLGYSFYILDNEFDIFPDNHPDSSISIHGTLTGKEGNQKIETLQYFHIGRDYQDRIVSAQLNSEVTEYALHPVNEMEGIITTSITEMEEYVWSALE